MTRSGEVDLVLSGTMPTVGSRDDEASAWFPKCSNLLARSFTLGPLMTCAIVSVFAEGGSSTCDPPSSTLKIGSNLPPFFLGDDKSGVVSAVELAGMSEDEVIEYRSMVDVLVEAVW